MAEKSQIDAKMIQKRSSTPGEIPTIPVSNNHTDGSWLATDIYEGEFFFNIPDEALYTRLNGSILEIGVNRGIERDVFDLAADTSVFATTKNILNNFAIFVDGVLTTVNANKTGAKEITTSADILDGSRVEIIY